jgi:hypothetical protein
MEDEPPQAEKEAKREAACAKGRAHAVTVTYHKANAEKRAAAAVARRLPMSDADR